MLEVKMVTDPEEFQYLWKRYWPEDCIFDYWHIRKCFADLFGRESIFVVIANRQKIKGILPLSWIDEKQCYSFFPGETWQGNTWLEQNRIYAENSKIYNMLLENVPGPSCIRYLLHDIKDMNNSTLSLDEFNYKCFPGQFNYSFDGYRQLFSGKSIRKLDKELSQFDKYGISFRYDHFTDLDIMFAINKNTYGENSYFHDVRFMQAFESIAAWLRDNKMLRITTVIIGGKVAAVDMGALCNGTYTLLAGGTSKEFPGVAKLINFHHIEWACGQKIECVDFMCGDFGWKQRFHLSAVPLYKLNIPELKHSVQPEYSLDREQLSYVV